MIDWLENLGDFPPLENALVDPNGLLCASRSLTPEMVVAAYCHGIFPWYSDGEPVLWWSPDPRMVLFPSKIRISRSMRRLLNSGGFEVKFDQNFEEVITCCGQIPRVGQEGTWITDDIRNVYCQLFEMGFAHCVETWVDGTLVGGLYGLAIGKMFYGESMFSRQSNASKIALIHLAMFLDQKGFGMIDCQMNTPHLASMGAQEIPRQEFVDKLQQLTLELPIQGGWPTIPTKDIWLKNYES